MTVFLRVHLRHFLIEYVNNPLAQLPDIGLVDNRNEIIPANMP